MKKHKATGSKLHPTTHRKIFLIISACLFVGHLSSAAELWYNPGLKELWEGFPGYKAGISNVSSPTLNGQQAIKCKIEQQFDHRQDMRMYDVGGVNLGEIRKYIFAVRGDDIQTMVNNGMSNWIFQVLLQFAHPVTGVMTWKPTASIAVDRDNTWTLNRYEGSGVAPQLVQHVIDTNVVLDNSEWVMYTVRIKYRQTASGRITVYKNGVKLLDLTNIQTWFDDVDSSNFSRHHFGLMNYLVHGYKNGVTDVTTYFDEIKVFDF